MTLAEFLTARIDDDEAVARAAQTDVGSVMGQWVTNTDVELPGTVDWCVFRPSAWRGHYVHAAATGLAGDDRVGIAQHIARQCPARVLADVAAKRAVIAIADGYEAGWPATDNDADWDMDQILQALAVPYKDHPDYQQEWA